jgi:DNA invertase Pin-like site-specific DNA recombinase
MSEKILSQHLARKAVLYVRQSSAFQVTHNLESQKLQYAMQNRLRDLGFTAIEVIDEDSGRSAAGTQARSGFERMVAEVCLGRVGAVAAREVSRFARNSREWQQLVEVCRVVDTVLIDQEMVYAPRASNDRLLLGLKGSLNEYELDLLRARSLEARRSMAKRGELIVIAPVGFRKTEDHRLEKDPDRRVQEAIRLVFDQFERIGSVRQTLLWFHEHGLELPAVTPRGEVHWKRPIYGTIYQLLTNPAYGGAYAYGKSERGARYEAGIERKHDRRKPRDQWLALIPGTHEGYVDWSRYERIQGAISGNLQIASRSLGAAREGTALVPRRHGTGGGTAALPPLCREAHSALHWQSSRRGALRLSSRVAGQRPAALHQLRRNAGRRGRHRRGAQRRATGKHRGSDRGVPRGFAEAGRNSGRSGTRSGGGAVCRFSCATPIRRGRPGEPLGR